MYSVSPFANDRVVELRDVPQPSVNAACPVVVAGEDHLFVLYVLQSIPEGWYDTWVKIMSPDAHGEPFALIVFHHPVAYGRGVPDDEALQGHPLHKRGLRPNGAFEIENSSWQDGLMKTSRFQTAHRVEHYHHYRHFVLAFRDTAFECLAETYSIRLGTGSVLDAAVRVLDEIK
ncbi:MAG TPA: hypothetical protein VEI04_04915 [Syntrophobacteria bacterium]|nr:hypothetical protein [Syntrophobacteria bacterium]